MSENGWIDQELFFLWLEKLFIPHIPPHRPVLLLLDGHGSHYTPEAISKAAVEGVIVLCIPPNTTHKAQPLDVSFFAPLKRHWSSVYHSFMVENPGSVVTKLNFSSLFSKAWMKAENIINGFRKTGVCPLNKEAIECPTIETSSELPSESPSEASSICSPPNDVSSMGVSPSNSESTNNSSPPPPVCEVSGATSPLPPVIGDSDSTTPLPLTSGVSDSATPLPLTSGISDSTSPPAPFFTAEQIEKFETRYSNGYDLLIDNDYVSWLKINHPESLPGNLSLSGSVTTPSNKNEAPDRKDSESLTPVTQSLASARKVLSDMSEFLTFPPNARSSKKQKQPGAARVLTSEESLAMLLEKEKKREEEEAKVKRKQDREEKRLKREKEKEMKAKERELKAIERQQKAAEKAALIEERKQQREARKAAKPKVSKTFLTRSKTACGPQHSETSSNECTVCFGNYDDDMSDDGTPAKVWVQCTSSNCGKWMHEDCTGKDQDGRLICVCGAIFI